ncbi:MAG: UbiA family prenyltransferase [Thermomicrobiales bacterium]
MRSIENGAGSEPSTPAMMLGYVRLIHPVPVLFVMIGTAAFGLLAAGGNPDLARFFLMIAAMLGGQIAIGAHNEWRDRQHDARHQPEKPIPAGLVNPRHVRPIVAGGLALGAVAGIALGFWPFALLAIGTGSGFVYNIWLKRTPLSGIPYLMSLPLLPIWATLVMDSFEPRLIWLYPLGGAYVVAVHLAQSLSDITGDRASGTRGLAVVLGRRRTQQAIWIIAIGTALAMPAGAFLVGDRPIYGAGSGAIALSFFGWFLIHPGRRSGADDSRQFQTLCTGAAILAAGWFLSIAG